jgi:hypothetical protein
MTPLGTLMDQEAYPLLRSAPCAEKKLAQIILASACNGKRDVAQLKDIALRGVSGRTGVPL